MVHRRKLIAGNWKMNGTSADLPAVEAIAAAAGARELAPLDIALCLPATLIERASRAAPGLNIGGQDCHQAASGAHTGDISAAMLRDAGAALVIVGHSERRCDHGESNAAVRSKAEAALAAGLGAILCVGESLAERESGRALEIVSAQLDQSLPRSAADPALLAIAYEPVWAIGTGRVAAPSDIEEMHAALRERLVAAYGEPGGRLRILYGGSVKPANAAAIFAVAEVDGALVGGASLDPAEFLPIVKAALPQD